MDSAVPSSTPAVMSAEQERVKLLLQDAVVKFCQDNLQFHEVNINFKILLNFKLVKFCSHFIEVITNDIQV